MKTLLLAPCIFAALTLPGIAQVNAPPVPVGSSPPPPELSQRVTAPDTIRPPQWSRMPDGFAMVNGTVYLVQNGAATRVDAERVMRISPNGTVTMFDGRTVQIPAGQLITTDGRIVPVITPVTDSRAAEAAVTPSNENAQNYSGLAPYNPAAQSPAAIPAATTNGSQQSAPTATSSVPFRQGNGVSRSNSSGGTAGGAALPFGVGQQGIVTVPVPSDPPIPEPPSGRGSATNPSPNSGGTNPGAGVQSQTGGTTTNPNARSTTGGQNSNAGGTGTSTGTATGTGTGTGAGTSGGVGTSGGGAGGAGGASGGGSSGASGGAGAGSR